MPAAPSPSDALRKGQARARDLAERIGPAKARALLRRAERDLKDRLARLPALRAGREEPFTVAQMRVTLEQIRAALHAVGPGMRAAILDGARDAAASAATATTDYIERAERAYRGVNQPLAIDHAAVLDATVSGTESSVLRRIRSDPDHPGNRGVLDRYGESVIGHFEEALQMRLLARKPWAEVRQDLIDGSPFLQGKPLHWAERILRTESMNASNRAGFESMRQANRALGGDMVRILSCAFDSRTGADSVAVHGQVRRTDEPFESWNGRFMHPPDRPNDRAVVVPHRLAWGPPPRQLAPKSDGEVSAAWAREGRKGSPPPRPPMSTVDLQAAPTPPPAPQPPPKRQEGPEPEPVEVVRGRPPGRGSKVVRPEGAPERSDGPPERGGRARRRAEEAGRAPPPRRGRRPARRPSPMRPDDEPAEVVAGVPFGRGSKVAPPPARADEPRRPAAPRRPEEAAAPPVGGALGIAPPPPPPPAVMTRAPEPPRRPRRPTMAESLRRTDATRRRPDDEPVEVAKGTPPGVGSKVTPPTFADAGRTRPLLKVQAFGEGGINQISTAEIDGQRVFVKPQTVKGVQGARTTYDPRDAVAMHEAVRVSATALGVEHTIQPAALRSGAGETPSFVTRSASGAMRPLAEASAETIAKVPEHERVACAVIDLLHRNSDRHSNNVLVDPDGRITLIDHDRVHGHVPPAMKPYAEAKSVFFPTGHLGYEGAQRAIYDLPKPAAAHVRAIVKMTDASAAKAFGIAKEEAAAMRGRARLILDHGLDAALAKDGARTLRDPSGSKSFMHTLGRE